MQKEPLTFHMSPELLTGAEPLPAFYSLLWEGLRARGAEVRLLDKGREAMLQALAADQGFHIAHHGRLRHPRLLNSGVAYMYPFYNLDPWGIRALSSIAERPFDAGAVPMDLARPFVRHLRRRMVEQRRSRYPQPMAVAHLPKGAIAVFLQTEDHRDVAENCYLNQREMLWGLIGRSDPRPILVKPHPRDTNPATMDRLSRMARRHPKMQVVDANIHDMIAAADVVVTINSATGIEAMLHKKPVVLCGQSDFHHAAVTCRSPSDLDNAIARAEAAKPAYAAFLWWYFAQNCLSARSPTLVDDFLARIAATGYDVAALGMEAGAQGVGINPPSPPVHQ